MFIVTLLMVGERKQLNRGEMGLRLISTDEIDNNYVETREYIHDMLSAKEDIHF